jgi:hypothetical protein
MVLRNIGGADVIAWPDEQYAAKSVGGWSALKQARLSISFFLEGALSVIWPSLAKAVEPRSSQDLRERSGGDRFK